MADGTLTSVDADELDRDASRAIFERRGTYRRIIVTMPSGVLR